ncbi:O-antigen/teichoic acid export membrane protein [Litoreibacter ponti]|uniref:O-antigen/teichoic acid export membrane protein n=1 Tax=Litoreibacter ponti TaxID=1510457 RepID=A0A2T6BPD3_9RHOB|nr:oligosaccharide flippase family protein [Litoreibacter ponti]PTX57939.1 O-antigen/teichoic acid export membrane protein [Litoreibacter ponti]
MSGIVTLLIGHGLTAGLTFARNLLLARFLGLEDYSVAIILSLVISAVELMTSIGIPQLCVSHPRGGSRQMQAGLHGMQIIRGIFGGVLILILAHPLAHALEITRHVSLLMWSALIPIVMGFCHLDPFRAQRTGRHLRYTLFLIVPAAVSVSVVVIYGKALLQPEVMLFALIAHAIGATLISHALALHRYQFHVRKALVVKTLRYGMPIAANGALLFAVLHLEKLIAGHALGLPELGLVAMGATLTLTPFLIASKSFQAYHLPRLRHRPEAALLPLLAQAAIAAVLIALPTIVAAQYALSILADGFQALGPLLHLFVLVAAVRLPKSALSTLALARGQTRLPVWANLPRLLAAPAIWYALSHGGSIETLLYLALLSECAGLVLGLMLALRLEGRPNSMRAALP